LSFASKLPKADLKDPLGMKTYLSVLTQVLPAVSPQAAVIAKGFDFVSTDDRQESFRTLIQQKHTHEILQREFIELTSAHEEPVTFGEVFTGKELIKADQMLRSVLALSCETETLKTLSAFSSAAEKIDHVRTTLMLKTHSETVHLFSFLGTNNFDEFANFAEWSAEIFQKWKQIDFENIDHFDILKFVLFNTSRKYKPIIQKIMLDHPDADYDEINHLVSKWEEMHRILNVRFRNSSNKKLAANAASITRHDGSLLKCYLCEGNHKAADCPDRGKPKYADRRHELHTERSDRQGKNKPRGNQTRRPPWKGKSDDNTELESVQKQLKAQQALLIKLTDKLNIGNKTTRANVASTSTIPAGSWAGVVASTPQPSLKTFTVNMMKIQIDVDTLSDAEQKTLLSKLTKIQQKPVTAPTTPKTETPPETKEATLLAAGLSPATTSAVIYSTHPVDKISEEIDRIMSSNLNDSDYPPLPDLEITSEMLAEAAENERHYKRPSWSGGDGVEPVYVKHQLRAAGLLNETRSNGDPGILLETASTPPSVWMLDTKLPASPTQTTEEKEKILLNLLLKEWSEKIASLDDEITQKQHELMILQEQRQKFREPISTLIRAHQRGNSQVQMRRDSNIDNPNFATEKPACTPRRHQERWSNKNKKKMGKKFLHRKQSKKFRQRTRLEEIAKIQERMSCIPPKSPGAFAGSIEIPDEPPAENEQDWYLDSGAATSFVNDTKHFASLERLSKPIKIISAIKGATIICQYHGLLTNGLPAYYCPEFENTLISAQQLSKLIGALKMSDNEITDKHDHRIAKHDGQQYVICKDFLEHTALSEYPAMTASTSLPSIADLQLLFRQTGAPGQGTMLALADRMDGVEKRPTVDVRTLYKHYNVVELIARSRQIATSFKNTEKLDKRGYIFLEKLCSDTAHEPAHESLGGHHYWELIKDYHSNWYWVIPLQNIRDLAQALPAFLERIQNTSGKSIRVYKTDCHPGYQNKTIQQYLAVNGITYETNTPYTSQQNGRAESGIRVIRNKARALLINAHLPVQAWNFAVTEAARIINLLPCTANPGSLSPYEMVTGQRPHRSQLLVFGSIAWVKTHPDKRVSKMDPVATPYIYVGQDQQGFLLWDPRLTDELSVFHAVNVYFDQTCTWTETYVHEIAHESPITRTTSVTEHTIHPEHVSLSHRDAENVNTAVQLENDSIPEITIDPSLFEGSDIDPLSLEGRNDNLQAKLQQASETVPKTPTKQGSNDEVTTPPRTPHNKPKTRPPVKSDYNLRSRLKNIIGKHKEKRTRRRPLQANKVSFTDVNWMAEKAHYEVGVDEACRIPVPRNLAAAMEHPQWRAAVIKEIDSIMKNKTFEFVDATKMETLPRRVRRAINKNIRCHFVFRAKPDKDGKLLKFKARLVANGNNQQEGINYFSSFAPVAAASTIKGQIVHGLINHHFLESWDYSSAYLNGVLQEIIFIALPGDPAEYGITVPNGCRILLRKSIYGLVQAGQVWNDLLKKSLEKRGFVQCPYEPGLFVKTFEDGSIIVVTTYVDDLLVSADSMAHLDEEFKHLAADLPIGNREELSWHLGMHFQRFGDSATIDQAAYTIETINQFGMANAKGRRTPRKLESQVTKADAPKDEVTFNQAQKLPFRNLVGKLMYLSQTSRPDVSEAISESSKYFSNWGAAHWDEAKDILRYLRTSHDLPLVYHPKRTESPLEIYVDAAYANDKDSRRSQTGIAIFYYDCLIGWTSRRQKSVTLSSCEAEYVALTDAAKDAIHLRRVLSFIDDKFDLDTPTKIYEDNQGTIALAYSDGKTQARTKHIDIRMHFIRDYISEGIIEVQWVPTDAQKADFFTKPLAGPKHEEMRNLNMSCDMAPAGYNRKMTPKENEAYEQTGYAPGELRTKRN